MTGAAIATLTVSLAALLLIEPSRATIESDRAVVLEVVVENVTDRKAAWYWATEALPDNVSTPPE
jgi:hypothetical protein